MNSKAPSTARKGRPSEAGSQRDLRRRTSASPERLGVFGLSGIVNRDNVVHWYWSKCDNFLYSGEMWGLAEINGVFSRMIRDNPLLES